MRHKNVKNKIKAIHVCQISSNGKIQKRVKIKMGWSLAMQPVAHAADIYEWSRINEMERVAEKASKSEKNNNHSSDSHKDQYD